MAGREISALLILRQRVELTVMLGFSFANVPASCSICGISGLAATATVTGCGALPPPGASATGRDAKTGSREGPGRAEADDVPIPMQTLLAAVTAPVHLLI